MISPQAKIIALIGSALVVAGLLLGMIQALKVIGERTAIIERQKAEIAAAEQTRRDAEAAVADRDRKLIQINLDNRRLHDAIRKATQGNDCADQPIPPDLDRLLRERAAIPGPSLPTSNP